MRLNGFMKMSPCKDCNKHSESCHGTCEEYKRYTEELKEIKTTIFNNKISDKSYAAYKRKVIRGEYGKGGKK